MEMISCLLRKERLFMAVLLCFPLWIVLHTLLEDTNTRTSLIPRYDINETQMDPKLRFQRSFTDANNKTTIMPRHIINTTHMIPELLDQTLKSTLPPQPVLKYRTSNRTNFTCMKVSNTTLQTTNVKWQGVSSSRELFVFSAYFHRGKQVVEIVAVAKLKTKVKAKCSFVANSNGTMRVVNGELFIMPEHHLRLYGAAVLTCRIGPNVPKLKYVNINIVTDKKTERASLPVHYPQTKTTVNVTVCYPTLHSNYTDAHELIQNIATNSLFGAAKFFIYDHWIHPNLTKTLNVLVRGGLLELVSWKIPVSQIHYYGQIAAAQDCLYRNRYTSKFIVFQDLDEFIVPRRPESWIEMMETMSRRHPRAGTFVVRHTFFPKNWPDMSPNSEYDQEIRTNKLYILYKTTRHYQIMAYNQRSKLIVIPTRVKYMGIHNVPYSMEGFKESLVNVTDALLHHYREIKLGRFPKKVNSTTLKPYTRELVELTRNIWRCVKKK